MARRRVTGRSVNGIILLDKSVGMSSNDALQQVKRLFKAAKAGHTGSLDPLASGMLPICFGEATKFSQFLLDADKTYQVTAKLGERTTTCDAEGDVIESNAVPDLQQDELLSILSGFEGETSQIPSMFSAIKHNGQPLYKFARQGIEIERKARKIHIHYIDLLSYEPPYLTLQVKCSKGTYIRTLIDDIGQSLGCGAYVTSLRRLSVAAYEARDLLDFSQLECLKEEGDLAALDALLLPVSSSVACWPNVYLSAANAFCIAQGQVVSVPDAPASGWVMLSSAKEPFLGVGEILEDGRIAPRRLIATAS